MKQTNNPATRVGTSIDGLIKRVVVKGEILRADGRPGVRDKYYLVEETGYQRAAWQSATDRAVFQQAGLAAAPIHKVTKEYARANVSRVTQHVATQLQRAVSPSPTPQEAIAAAVNRGVLPGTATPPPATVTFTPLTPTQATQVPQPTPAPVAAASVGELRLREGQNAAKRGHVLGAWNAHTDYAGTECQKCGAALVVGTPEPTTQRQVWGPAVAFDCDAWLLRTQNGNAAEYQRQIGDPVPVPEEQPVLTTAETVMARIGEQVSVAITEALTKALAGVSV